MTVIESILKKYGERSIQRLGDASSLLVSVIPTGSLTLDLALGTGGIPRGRITEVLGPNQAGKCLTKDTAILTSSGYKTIETIFKECGLEPFCVTKTVPMKYPLINKNGDVEYTTHFTFNGRRRVYQITTKTGRVLKCTSNHPLMILNKEGYLVWEVSKDLKPGDVLLGRAGDKVSLDKNYIDTKEAYMLGLLVADAHFGKTRVSFTNDNSYIKDYFTTNINRMAGLENILVRCYDNNSKGSIEFYLNSKDGVSQFYEHYGLSPGKAKDKVVPEAVKNSSILVQKEFLRGYFESECSISVKDIEVISASYILLKDIQMMLRNIGIVGHLVEKKVKAYPDNKYFRLNIYSGNVDTFQKEIGFDSLERQKSLEKLISERRLVVSKCVPNVNRLAISYYKSLLPHKRSRKTHRIVDSLRHGGMVTTNILKKLLKYDSGAGGLFTTLTAYLDDNLVFDEVKEVIVLDAPEPTFDFVMSDTHTFIAEGIVNHNTSLCLHLVAQCQSLGSQAAFVDSEHALDTTWAETCGVDIDNLLISQPDYGEQALDIASMLVESGEVGLVVIDSVAALLPKAELEGEIGDAHMALTARLMSQTMRKYARIVNNSNTAVVFTNQLRKNIGVTWGNPEVTTGGEALKYYASVRIDVRKREDVKETSTTKDPNIVGSTIKARVIKNKVAPPFKVAEFVIMFDTGIDLATDVINLALQDEIIKKSGAWYTFDLGAGEQRLQGMNSLRKFLMQDKVAFLDLENKIRGNYGLPIKN